MKLLELETREKQTFTINFEGEDSKPPIVCVSKDKKLEKDVQGFLNHYYSFLSPGSHTWIGDPDEEVLKMLKMEYMGLKVKYLYEPSLPIKIKDEVKVPEGAII